MGGVFYFYTMQTFLEETLADIKKEHLNLSEITIILPSKRAGGFLKNHLRKEANNTGFAPKIISIEEFIEELSNLKIITGAELLFKSYEAYLQTKSIPEKDIFETFASWANSLLSDFSEMDRYLIETKPFFSYWESIKTMERWGVKDEKTPLIDNYLKFWGGLKEWYEHLREILTNDGVGYQGMVYREASETIEHYIANHQHKTHIFIGFNALNNAEEHIIQELLETGNTSIYWDTDINFYEDINHGASLFIRKYSHEWKYFQKNKLKFISNNFVKKKDFQIIEVQKNVGQAKYVGQLLSAFSEEKLSKTAVVLGDETLLIPILNSLPANVTSVNITMGANLKIFPATIFFEMILALHCNAIKFYYHKEVLVILKHPMTSSLLPNADLLLEKITLENSSHIKASELFQLSGEPNSDVMEWLFKDWQDSSKNALDACINLLLNLQKQFQENAVERVVLFHLYSIFKKMEALQDKFPYLTSVKTVHLLFTELIASTTLDFEGDAYNGLQIMGVLETRLLDFENIIITSVNEGVLPSGKSNASAITYDLKQQFGLPLYTEKDAIYTYHFYRLLHRATNISLLFNNHSEGINSGEKSRFLLQLEIEKKESHTLEKSVLSPKIIIGPRQLKKINKTPAVMERLREIAGKGFSPSALTSYIRNPIDFYFQKILRLQELEEIEETVAANTLGTIVHNSLEKLYKPLEGFELTIEILLNKKKNIEAEVTRQFQKEFKGNFSKGKNLITFEVAKRYISNFIDHEIAEIKNGNQIKIVQIETDIQVEIPLPEIGFPIKIAGKVDRVDEFNGQMRIIDYKTGFVNPPDLEVVHWNEIILDYKYSKTFQVLAYVLMMNKEIPIQNAEAGIISFKNMGNGFLKFATKEFGKKAKDQTITQETLEFYSMELKKLITEICDPALPFIEKEL